MGRQYTIEHYQERLARIREAVPGITISTDIIVGFCGETEATSSRRPWRLLETVRYDQVFAAAYSPRPGTPATHLADDVPADVKRRRLNELLALQEGIGLERNRAWLGREVEVLVDTVNPPRGHDHDDARSPAAVDGTRAVRPDARQQARPPRRGRGARRARGPRPHRPRRPVRAPRRARRRVTDAPPLIVVAGATATGKTELADPARRGDRDGGRPVGDHLGRLAPGLPRPRHRHGEGDRRGPGARPAPRPRPGRPGRAVQRRRLRDARPRRPRRPRGAPAASRSSPAAPGCTCAPSRAASTPTRCRATRPSARASKPSSTRDGLAPLVARLAAHRPDAGGDGRPRPIRAASSAPSRSPSSPATRRVRRPAATPGPVAWLGLTVEPADAPRLDRRASARRSSTPGSSMRHAALRERFDPALPAFSAIGYREAWAVLDGDLDARRRDRARCPAQRRLRQAPADLVPVASRPSPGSTRPTTCRSRPRSRLLAPILPATPDRNEPDPRRARSELVDLLGDLRRGRRTLALARRRSRRGGRSCRRQRCVRAAVAAVAAAIVACAACICSMAARCSGVRSDISCLTNCSPDSRVVQVEEDRDRQEPAERLRLHGPGATEDREEPEDDREQADEDAERPGVGPDVPEALGDPDPDRGEQDRPERLAPLGILEFDRLADERPVGDAQEDQGPPDLEERGESGSAARGA